LLVSPSVDVSTKLFVLKREWRNHRGEGSAIRRFNYFSGDLLLFYSEKSHASLYTHPFPTCVGSIILSCIEQKLVMMGGFNAPGCPSPSSKNAVIEEDVSLLSRVAYRIV